eukprot:UN00683
MRGLATIANCSVFFMFYSRYLYPNKTVPGFVFAIFVYGIVNSFIQFLTFAT